MLESAEDEERIQTLDFPSFTFLTSLLKAVAVASQRYSYNDVFSLFLQVVLYLKKNSVGSSAA